MPKARRRLSATTAKLTAITRQEQIVSRDGITDTIKSLSDLQTRCNLQRADSDRFFDEWIENLPQRNKQELSGIARIK